MCMQILIFFQRVRKGTIMEQLTRGIIIGDTWDELFGLVGLLKIVGL